MKIRILIFWLALLAGNMLADGLMGKPINAVKDVFVATFTFVGFAYLLGLRFRR